MESTEFENADTIACLRIPNVGGGVTKLIIVSLASYTGGLVTASIVPQFSYFIAFVALFVVVVILQAQNRPRLARQRAAVPTKVRRVSRKSGKALPAIRAK